MERLQRNIRKLAKCLLYLLVLREENDEYLGNKLDCYLEVEKKYGKITGNYKWIHDDCFFCTKFLSNVTFIFIRNTGLHILHIIKQIHVHFGWPRYLEKKAQLPGGAYVHLVNEGVHWPNDKLPLLLSLVSIFVTLSFKASRWRGLKMVVDHITLVPNWSYWRR